MNTTVHNTLHAAFGLLLTHSMVYATNDEITPVHSMDEITPVHSMNDEIIPVH